MIGAGCHAGRDQDSIEAAPHLVGPTVETSVPGGLQGEGILYGHEVDQAALGLSRQIDPVRRGEQLRGPGLGLPPGGGMPPGPVEGDRQVQRTECRHGQRGMLVCLNSLSSGHPVRRSTTRSMVATANLSSPAGRLVSRTKLACPSATKVGTPKA